MGSFAAALILFFPIYVGMKKFVIAYRSTLGVHIAKWKVYKVIDRSSLVQWYKRIRNWAV
jgi:hypothetical protein